MTVFQTLGEAVHGPYALLHAAS